MDWDLFIYFIVAYALTYVPMFFAGLSGNGGIKGTLFMADWVLTVIAYVLLWYAMPTTWTSLFACIFLGIGAYFGGQVQKHYGYDPYGYWARLAKKETL